MLVGLSSPIRKAPAWGRKALTDDRTGPTGRNRVRNTGRESRSTTFPTRRANAATTPSPGGVAAPEGCAPSRSLDHGVARMGWLDFREPVSAWTHGAWALLSLPAMLLLWARTGDNPVKRLGLMVFGVSLAACY